MKKLRFNLTVEDYFDYVGTHPYYNFTRRVKESLPCDLRDGYNMKFKFLRNKSSFSKWYRVHITVEIAQDVLDRMLRRNESNMHKFENLSYKELN